MLVPVPCCSLDLLARTIASPQAAPAGRYGILWRKRLRRDCLRSIRVVWQRILQDIGGSVVLPAHSVDAPKCTGSGVKFIRSTGSILHPVWDST